jgi:hypothetical protein
MTIGKRRCRFLFQHISDKYNMDANLDTIAKELYGKIQTRFPAIKIGDENAEVLSKKEDIPKARFFEFEYEENDEPLGTIAITLDPQEGLIIQVSGDITNDDDDSTRHGAFKFIRSFRQFAKDRLLNFDIQNIGKSNLDKRDYQFQAKRKEFNMTESKLFGTSRISYQNLGEARLIIKHSQPVNPEIAAGRSMHIESIYVENADGERFKYPFKHINGARALAEHLKHGGNPYDSIGKHITGLSEELAHLRKFKGFVTRSPVISETMGHVTDRVIERIEEIKKEITHLQRPTFYETFVESFEEREEQAIPEDIINDLVDRLTIRTFNEELKAAFPYIYKFLDESDIPVRELGIDDLLSEDDDECPKCHHDPCTCKKNKKTESFYPEVEFESFMESIAGEEHGALFSKNKSAQKQAIDELNEIMASELKGGPEGVNAIESLHGIIDDPEFVEDLKHIDPDLDVRPLIQQYILERDPSIANQLEFSGEEEPEEPEEEPVEPPPEEPMPEPEPEPAPPETPPQPAAAPAPQAPGAVPPMAETMDGTDDNPQKFSPAEEIRVDSSSSQGGLDEMLRFISGFYNREEKNFPLGGQRIKIKVKKDFEDGMFPNAKPEDLIKVLKFIDMKDPSTGEQNDIVRLAGVHKPQAQVTISAHSDPREAKLGEIMSDLNSARHGDAFESIVRLAGIKK